MSRTSSVSIVPCLTGAFLWAGASSLLLEDAWRTHLTVQHALMPLLTAATVASAVYFHKSLQSWRLLSALGFLLLATVGSVATIYGTLGRQVDATDAKQGDAMRRNRTLELKLAELATARTAAAQECRVIGQRCKDWQARVDRLSNETGTMSVVALDPRQDAIVRLAVLFRFDGDRTRAIVAAFDPILLPLFLELGSIVFFASAFGRKGSTVAGKSEESVEVRAYTREEALADLRKLKAAGSQKLLAARWNVSEPTVSKWMSAWQASGVRRQREGRCKQVALPPAQCLALGNPSGD
jgi:hypothetical protein